jgi:hypothetical protein
MQFRADQILEITARYAENIYCQHDPGKEIDRIF